LPPEPAPILRFADLPDREDQALIDNVTGRWFDITARADWHLERQPYEAILAAARFRAEVVPLSAFAGQFPRNARFYRESDDDPERAALVAVLAARYRAGRFVPAPVVLCANGSWSILDGQHRLTAAYLAGLKVITVARLIGFPD